MTGAPPAPPPPPRRKAPLRRVLAGAYDRWSRDEGTRRGAALSYYAAFSLAPLLLIVAAVAGVVVGEEAAQGLVSAQLRGFLGAGQAEAVEDMVASVSRGNEAKAGAVGFVMLLLGAAGVVGELRSSLMTMWGTVPESSTWVRLIKSRLVSAAFVLSLGFLLVVSLVVSTAAAAAGKWLSAFLPVPEAVFQALNLGLSVGMVAVVFALIFKYLPRARIRWGDVWIGAGLTAALFAGGNVVLGLYLGKAGPASVYGAAGSLLAVLLWTYYCAQILYFGAEFTREYAETRGSGFVRGHAPPA